MTPYAQIAKRLPSWLYKVGAQSWIDKKWPRHLFIETTAVCNLTCEYCPREKNKQHMDWELFRSIILEGSHYGSRSYSLHLFGEPLLYPQFGEAIRFIKKVDRRNTVLLTTNGTLLNRYCREVIESNPDLVLWTWRPEAKFTSETKEKLRKWGKFRVRFIDEITLESAREEWKDWPNVEGRKMHNYGGKIDITKLYGGVQIVGQDISLPIQNIQKKRKRWPCYHLWLAPAIAWNGNILICCADPHQKEVLGKFPNQSIAEVWQGKRLKAIRESHLKEEYKGICSSCDVWKQYPNLFFSWQRTGSSSSGNS